MAEKLLKYDVAMKSTKTVWQMDIPRANTGDENTVTFDFNITDLDSAELTGATPNVNLYMRDGSFFQCRPEEGVELNGQRVTYTMRENEGKHNGKAKAELVLIWPGTNPIQKLTSQQYAFEIANGLDTVVAVEVMIQDWTTLTAEAQVYLDQMAEKHAIADADHTRAETDHTTAVADHTTAASDHTTALADHAVTADMIANATNLVPNGDFSTGSAPWILGGTSPSAVYALDSKFGANSIRMTTTNTSSIVAYDLEVPVGNILYVGVWGKLLSITDGPYADSILTVHENEYTNVVDGTLDIGLLNIWQHVSLIKKATTSPVRVMGGHVGYTTRDLLVDGFISIDLTATFGKGNEPTVEQMDEIMSKFTNSWFDGTKNLFRASATLAKQIAIDARTEFDVKNEFTNGDFSNGIVGWGVNNATYSIANNVITITPTATSGEVIKYGNMIIGRKYYFTAWVKSSEITTMIFVDGVTVAHTGSGNFERLSMLRLYSGASGVFSVKTTKTSGWTPFDVKYISCIDLTATFGAGKEPTQAEMDRLMARFPNSWFDGVKPIQTIETLYQEKANKVQEPWITPTLLNGATGTVQYRKNNMGRLEFRGSLTGSSGNGMFVPVEGYRPEVDVRLICATNQAHSAFLLAQNKYASGAIFIDYPYGVQTIDMTGASYPL